MEPLKGAYFEYIEVENARCFGSKQRLDLTDADGNPARWTLILGDNGTGKTTLLQLVAASRPIRTKLGDELEGWHLGETPPVDLSRKPGGLTSVEVSFGGFECGWQFAGRAAGHDAFVGEVPDIAVHAYGASRRPGSGDLAEVLDGDPWATLFDSGARLINAEAWLLRLDYQKAKSSNGVAAERLERVRGVLERLLPDVNDIHFEFPDQTGLAEDLTGTVRLKTPYGEVGLWQLSLGYQTVASWTLDLAARLMRRYPESPDPLAEPAIVLVDEIDLHLHPRWQRQVVENLTSIFTKTQFIATAHSPLVALASAEHNLAVLRREGDEVVIENDPVAVDNWRVDQVLTSELFGLDSARALHIQRRMDERATLIKKTPRTDDEEARLAELDEEALRLPTESPEIEAALQALLKAAGNGK